MLGLVLALSSVAQATSARMLGLAGNAGFVDDTDFFQYPSVAASQPARASLNYNGAFDGGFSLDDGRVFWLQRANALASASGFQATYARAQGETGYLLRASQDGEGLLTLGGGWSRGDKSGASNLAVDGDVRVFGNLANKFAGGVTLAVTSRALTQKRLTTWKAGLDYYSDDEAATLFGGYSAGPRYQGDGGLRGALQVGPLGAVTVPTGDNTSDTQVAFSVPFVNLAAEYTLREWLSLRGAAVAAWVGTTDTGDLVENLSWQVLPGGSVGVGFAHQGARFDMSISPGWLLSGPYILSGTSQQMFGQLSARIDL